MKEIEEALERVISVIKEQQDLAIKSGKSPEEIADAIRDMRDVRREVSDILEAGYFEEV